MKSPFPGELSLTIAGLTVRVRCNHAQLAQSLRVRYKDFVTEGKPAVFTAEIEWDEAHPQDSQPDTQARFQAGVLHFTAPDFRGFINEKNGTGQLSLCAARPVEPVDYYLRVVYALLARHAGGLLFHAAGIIRNRRAYLFFGHSGSGKTTVCRVSSADHIVLNDDLVVLMPRDNSWQVFGTPFWNPTQVKPSSQSAPLKEMYLLTQSKRVAAQELAAGQAIAAMVANVPIIPQDPVRSRPLLDTLTQIQQTVPVRELFFLPDNSFWHVIPH